MHFAGQNRSAEKRQLRKLLLMVAACSFGFLSPMAAKAENTATGLRELSLPSATAPSGAQARALQNQQQRISNFENTAHAPNPDLVLVSLDSQQLTVYNGMQTTRRSKVSSGKKGHETPTGIFSILEKRRFHKSNIYSDAPMPFMQRLTWSGIALHESAHVPDRPASHGCVRLPAKEAEMLYEQLETGTHVIISEQDLMPTLFVNPQNFQPKPVRISMAALRTGISALSSDDSDGGNLRMTDEPLRIYFTRKTRREIVRHMQELLVKRDYQVTKIDGLYGRETAGAVISFQKAHGLAPTGMLTDELLDKLYEVSGIEAPPAGILYVRQGHKPVFQSEFQIKWPQRPLGTHFLLSANFSDAATDWVAMTIPTRIPRSVISDHKLSMPADNEKVLEPLSETFRRLDIPKNARDFIERHLTPGSSIAISDNGIGTETGKGTDFIVQTF